MLPLTQAEIAALQMVLSFVSLRELLIAAQAGFDEEETTSKTENADLCYKAIKSFLN